MPCILGELEVIVLREMDQGPCPHGSLTTHDFYTILYSRRVVIRMSRGLSLRGVASMTVLAALLVSKPFGNSGGAPCPPLACPTKYRTKRHPWSPLNSTPLLRHPDVKKNQRDISGNLRRNRSISRRAACNACEVSTLD